MASALLREGRLDAERRRRGDRTWAGIGISGAVLAGLGTRTPQVTRRRLLRGLLTGAGLMALTPGVGLSILSEVLVPDEIYAFKTLANRLEELRGFKDGDSVEDELRLAARRR